GGVEPIWEGSGYAFCEAHSGDRDVWPENINPECPICEREFVLDDYLALAREQGREVLYHNSCLEAKGQG
ncbi:MAG: hypothetical protein ACE5IZ_03195, partial [Dehalococcoidia bacterium]